MLAPAPSRKTAGGAGRESEACSMAALVSQTATSRPPDRPAGDRRIRPSRGGVRTSVLSLLAIAGLVVAVVIVLARSLAPPEHSSPQAESTSGAPVSMGQSGPAPAGPEISGTVSIARDLAGRLQDTSVLFIIARKASGPPFAVKRIASPRFPLAYRIGPENLMMAGSSFEGEVYMGARVAHAGTAGPPQPGDLEGEHPVPVRVGARNVNIAISRIR